MTISAIIPVYLSYNFLEKNFRNISKQTYKNLEIIYVNDGSPDSSKEFCEQFCKLDNRVIYIEQHNLGAAEALNTGIKNATGDYIMFLDADDWIEENTCELALNAAIEHNADMVFWPNIKEYATKSVFYPSFFPESKLFDENEITFLRRRMIGLVGKELKDPMKTDAFNAGWGKLYKADTIKNNGIKWTDTFLVGSSDVLFNAQVMPYVNRAYYLNEHLHHYNKNNPNSLTKNYKNTLRAKFENLFADLELVIRDKYSNDNLELFKEALNNRIALSIINIGLVYGTNGFKLEEIKMFDNLINSNPFMSSLKNMKISYLPIHYRLFFIFCKIRFTFLAYCMLLVMIKLRNK